MGIIFEIYKTHSLRLIICVFFCIPRVSELSLLVMGESQKGMRCGITSGTRMKPGAGGAWLLLYGWGYVNPRSELLKK
jgi:hypothetical protein